jgi:2-phosphosulfolactate phosphatase
MHRWEPRLEVLFAPAEFNDLAGRDLWGATCVVLDVLRATSSIITALANGAEAILPVAEISDALEVRAKDPAALLAGEREGRRITARLANGIEFDFGNSPREFSSDKVAGKRIVMSTTNGTRALRACARASRVLAASFLNLSATSAFLRQLSPDALILVCSGTFEQTALEDALCAGALCAALAPHCLATHWSDSALMAQRLFALVHDDLRSALARSRNGRRLLSLPDLADDVSFCARIDACPLAAGLSADGWIRRADREIPASVP